MRGSHRLLQLLGTIPSQRIAPIQIADWPPVYVDLQVGDQGLFTGSPWASTPIEPHTVRVIDAVTRPGDTVYDIGANYGIMAVRLAQAVGPSGRVEVFEPNPLLHGPLERTLAAIPWATLHRVALSDADDVVTLHVPGDHSMASLSRWHETHNDQGARGYSCRAARLDTYVPEAALPMPNFIKVDVEGAERLVFEGARALLDRVDAPIVIFEENAPAAAALGRSQSDARDFLLGLASPRYECFLVERDTRALRPASGEVPGWSDLLAVPARAMARVQSLLA